MQKKNKQATIFEGKKIRRVWDGKQEKWYFSVVDIVGVLTNQMDFQLARNYWKVLKNRLKKEGSETVTKCNRLKMEAEDGKLRETDAADVETFRQIAQAEQARGLEENKEPAKKGGRIAKHARLELEQKTGKPVVSKENFKLLASKKPERLT